MRTMIAGHLGERGFVVDGFGLGREALEAARTTRYAAAILDLGLPDMDGIDLLRRLRGGSGAPCPLPALVLTARDGVQDRVRGLDAGADEGPVSTELRVAVEAVDALLAGLDRRGRTILVARLAGRPQSDVARQLGISASAVSQRVRRGGLAVIADAITALEGVR